LFQVLKGRFYIDSVIIRQLYAFLGGDDFVFCCEELECVKSRLCQ